MYQLIVLSALVLLPLIPAFILFKILRSDAKVDGDIVPGLKVSLGGSFGGYVALTVFLATYFSHMPQSTVWHVEGEMKFPEGTPSVVTCNVHPPEFTRLDDHKFKLDLPIAEGGALPSLVLSAAGYPSQTINLVDPDGHLGKEFDVHKYESTQTINISKPIVFQKEPDYQPLKLAEGGRK
jgi:hypothetical protein